MKPKVLILMVVAIGCGLVASYMTSRLLAERGKQQTEEKITILVARQKLDLGTLIKEPEKVFMPKQYVLGEEPKKAIRSYDQLKGRRLNKPVGAEQFVTTDDLMDADASGVGALVPKGLRAIAIKVNVDTAVAGFVLPNSRVDIISTRRSGDGSKANIFMQNVLVLAVNQLASRPDDKSAVVANTVTVAVSPQDCEKLALASEMGTLRLTLRGFGDEKIERTRGATVVQIGRDETPIIAEGEDEDKKGEAAPANPVVTKLPELPPGPPAPQPAPPSPAPVAAAPKKVETVAAATAVQARPGVLIIYNGPKLQREQEVRRAVQQEGTYLVPVKQAGKGKPPAQPKSDQGKSGDEPADEPPAEPAKPEAAPATDTASPADEPGADKAKTEAGPVLQEPAESGPPN
jgi:pilus assembly protein CpaB